MAENFTTDKLDDGVFSNSAAGMAAEHHPFNPAEFQQSTAPARQGDNFSPAKLHGTVYLDMGHCTSGEPNPFDRSKLDQGFIGPGYTECQMNTQVGTRLIAELRQAGLRVVPTWDPAHPPSPVPKTADLNRRNKVVNDDIAAHCTDSLYLSLHHDSDQSHQAGQCVFVDGSRREQSMPLARMMQESATEVRQRKGVESCINTDSATQNGKLVGLRGVNAIGVLVEARNVMNAKDAQTMPQPLYQEEEAHSLAQGVINYFKLQPGVARPYAACLRDGH